MSGVYLGWMRGGECEMTGFMVSNRADVMQISKNHQLARAEGVIDVGIVLAEGYLLSFLKLLTLYGVEMPVR